MKFFVGIIIGFVLGSCSCAHAAMTCGEMRAARALMGEDAAQAFLARATPAQIAAGKKCFPKEVAAAAQAQAADKPAIKVDKPVRQSASPAKKIKKLAAKLRRARLKHAAVPLPPVKPASPVVQEVAPQALMSAAASTAPISPQPEKRHMSTFDFLVYLVAFIGGVWIVYQVYSRGLVPFATGVAEWWSKGETEVREIKARLDAIEALLAPHLDALKQEAARQVPQPPAQSPPQPPSNPAPPVPA